jgi:hypothetical protein
VLIVGNLDVEVTWARMDAAARRARGEKAPSPDDPRFALPEAVMRKISAAATLMRVFARDEDDVLWTPRPVDPARMADVPWLLKPRLVSGPVPAEADVWWGQPTEVAARVNHRSLVIEARETGGRAEPDAVMVASINELRRRASGCGPWVAKAPHSAAGRLRVRGARGELTDAARRQAETLLELYGTLLFEPWYERHCDLGVAGHVFVGATPASPETLDVQETHVLGVDAQGRFQGITVGGYFELPPGRDEAQFPALDVADLLLRYGYRGPFGVDVFLVACPGVPPRAHLSEINARHTFGHVANALASKVISAFELPTGSRVTLRFGRGAPPPDTIPLLLPGADDDTSAWLEGPARHAG